jgi:hypothetical protein
MPSRVFVSVFFSDSPNMNLHILILVWLFRDFFKHQFEWIKFGKIPIRFTTALLHPPQNPQQNRMTKIGSKGQGYSLSCLLLTSFNHLIMCVHFLGLMLDQL